MLKKAFVLFVCSMHSLVFAKDPIYLSNKQDEEMVSRLFEITRRVNISNDFGMWKQDMLKMTTLSCAMQTKVINEQKNIIMPNDIYSPIFKKDDIDFLNYLNKKVGTFSEVNLDVCYQMAKANPVDLFSNCYMGSVLKEGNVLPNGDYPNEYLIVNSNFENGSTVIVGMYCDGIKGKPQTKQMYTTKGLVTWTVPPKYQKINFGRWQENLFYGTTAIHVEGIPKPFISLTIVK